MASATLLQKNYQPLPAGYVIESISPSVDQLKNQYAQLGLTNTDRFVTGTGKNRKFNETKAQEATIREIYKLDPKSYVVNNRLDFNSATSKYQFELPKISKTEATSLTSAVNAFRAAVDAIKGIGVENINSTDRATIGALAKQVRDYDSKDLSPNARQIITDTIDAERAINSVYNQIETVRVQDLRRQNKDINGKALGLNSKELEAARGRYETEVDNLRRITAETNQAVPGLSESLSRLGLADIAPTVGAGVAGVGKLESGLEALRGDNMFQTGALAGKLGSQVTDEQILGDINTARKNQFKSLYDIGTSAVTDLQSQISTAQKFLSDLPSGDIRRADAQKQIDSLQKELTTAQADTLEAKNLYENYTPISGTQATTALSQFRESLRLPEQRTLDQIREIDPKAFQTIQSLQRQYGQMAREPLGATTTPQTEQLRQTIEQEAINQLRLGSTLGAEERRGYEQAVRSAQTARGNIFGLGPAVQEAAQIGAMGEQRKLARLGAAAQFLGSGETTGAAAARDVALRQGLQQQRLGAAAEFMASGPTAYNLASQRLGQQQGLLQNYLAASTPQSTGQFQATPTAMTPYAYVNPQAGFAGAQNAANIYNTLADYTAQTYGANVGAIASQPTFAQQFGQIATGVGNLLSPFKFS
jgi:DNA uptake protein ComE-like DNA-binding protein